ncbi:MAG TPA: hypothetical protein VGX00_05800 [Thermoplasmata archaeon]|nr:hypothetical protein [Thermoplasmata archaeon]
MTEVPAREDRPDEGGSAPGAERPATPARSPFGARRWRLRVAPEIRAIAVLAIVVLLFAYPWKADGSATQPADLPAVDSIYPENSTSVVFDAAHATLGVNGPSPGTVRVDLLHTIYPFTFQSVVRVDRQSGPLPSDWRTVSASAPWPAGGKAFDVYFGAWNGTTVDVANVTVAETVAPHAAVFTQNFTNSTARWHLSPHSTFGVFGDPALEGIQSSTLGLAVGDATMLDSVPVPAGVSGIDVTGLVRFNGTPGPFHIVVDVLGSNLTHLAYLDDWPAWSNYSLPPAPVTVSFWDAALPYSVDIAWIPSGPALGSVTAEYAIGGVAVQAEPIQSYQLAEPIALSVGWSPAHNLTFALTPPGGTTTYWSTAQLAPRPGLTELLGAPQNTVSAYAETPIAFASTTTFLNASFTFRAAGTFTALSSGDGPAIAGTLAGVAVVGLFAPEWAPSVRRWARWWPTLSLRSFARSTAHRLRSHWLALGVAGVALGFYGYLAENFGGHPYDNWTFKVWILASQANGTRGLYVQPEFVGEAIVRGTVPWSTVGFGYGPVCAELFQGLSRLVAPLSGYPSVVALNGATGVSAEIKWLLALGTIGAGIVLYALVRRTTGRSLLGVAGFLLLVVNPAIAFDSVVWGETDSILYFLFVLFAVAAAYRPSWAMVVAGIAIAFKETGPILLLPAALLVAAPGLAWGIRLKRVALLAATLLLVTIPVLWAGLLPSVLVTPYLALFSNFVTGNAGVHPFVSPETYTVWTLFTPFVGVDGIDRMMVPSATALLPGVSFSVLGTAAFGLAALAALGYSRSAGRTESPAFWLLATSFSAIIFTALLTGTGSRYYTLAIPGLAGTLALAWPGAGPRLRGVLVTVYAIPTAISFWTMWGLFTVIMRREYPDIRGLGLSYNPVSRFVALGYPNGVVITLGSLGAVALVVLVSALLVQFTRRAHDSNGREAGPASRGPEDPDAIPPRPANAGVTSGARPVGTARSGVVRALARANSRRSTATSPRSGFEGSTLPPP